MTEEKKRARDKVSDGIRQGIGVLSAFKDALEETIQEARERGDFSSERAKQVMKTALDRAHEAAGEARERLDFVSQKEFDGLREFVDDLGERIQAIEKKLHKEGEGSESEE